MVETHRGPIRRVLRALVRRERRRQSQGWGSGGPSSNWAWMLTCCVTWKPHCSPLWVSFPHKLNDTADIKLVCEQ